VIVSGNPEKTRIVEQRLRNRIIEALEHLALGDAAVTQTGFAEYFEGCFDFAPYEGQPERNSALSENEVARFSSILTLMRQACGETPSRMPGKDFIHTGWPTKIAVAASECLAVFARRGRLSEDVVEMR